MTPTLTKREQACVALCRQNHSGQVRDLLDIIDRLTKEVELLKDDLAFEQDRP